MIVGAGTAGCVLANRLSADPACRVIVLEAGAEGRSRWIRMPAGRGEALHAPAPRLALRDRARAAARQPARCTGRAARCVGGTSSINGMTYVRGHRADYDALGARRRAGLVVRRVAALFPAHRVASARAEPLAWRRRSRCGSARVAYPHPLSDRFRAAMINAGVPDNPDYNGATQEGVGVQPADDGGRATRLRRDRVSRPGAHAREPARRHADARAAHRRGGRPRGRRRGRACRHDRRGARAHARCWCAQARSRRRSCCSCRASAPPRCCSALGIAVVADRASVGRNLQEHVRTQVVVRTRVPELQPGKPRPRRSYGHVASLRAAPAGLLTATASQVNAFVRSSPDVARPDLQIVFRPMSGDYVGRRFASHRFPGVMAMVGLSRPRSRGSDRAAIGRPDVPPRDRDRASHRSGRRASCCCAGLRLVRRVFATTPVRAAVESEMQPGTDVDDDDALLAYIHANANSLFHAVGTCAMGATRTRSSTPDARGARRRRVCAWSTRR